MAKELVPWAANRAKARREYVLARLEQMGVRKDSPMGKELDAYLTFAWIAGRDYAIEEAEAQERHDRETA